VRWNPPLFRPCWLSESAAMAGLKAFRGREMPLEEAEHFVQRRRFL